MAVGFADFVDIASSLFDEIVAFVKFALFSFNLFVGFYTTGNRKRLLFQGRDIFLRISDLSLEENGRMGESAFLRMPEDAVAIAAIKREPRGCQPQIDVDNLLARVPDSIQGNVTIYLENGLGPQVFQNYFSRNMTNAARDTYADPTTRGYNGLSFQWRVPEPNAWFETPSMMLSGEDPPGLVINVKKVSTVEHSGGGLILLISSETWESPSFFGMQPVTDDSAQAITRVLDSLNKFALDFEQLQNDYQPLLMKAKSIQMRKQVLLLWFHHVHLSHTIRSFEEVRRMYQTFREPGVDSGKLKLLPDLLDEVINDANLFRELEAMAEDLVSTLEALLDVVRVGFEKDADGAPKINTIAADLRGLSSDLRRKAGDPPKTLAHHLNFLEMRRSIRESDRLSILTILASVFLPLSLACGILSMQTRVKDLGYLLYDSLGAVCLLLTFAAWLLLFVKGSMTIVSKISRWGSDGRRFFTGAFAIIVSSIWAIMVASFIVGMAVNVRLGGLVLGYGLAGLTGIALLLCIATLAYFFKWHSLL